MRKLNGKKILIIVENLPSPFDRRVWQEAETLKENGAKVYIICPKGKGYNKSYELINGIEIFRHKIPIEADKAFGYLFEYGAALFWEFLLSVKIFFSRGFDVIHACNPPDLIFLVALPFKLLGKKFLFDHHDINPELYLAKFKRKDFFYRLMVRLERATFKFADISIATNESYKQIAMTRGRKKNEDVYIVRSGPSLDRLIKTPQNINFKKGKKYLVGYVGVIGKQEGLNYLIEACEYIVKTKKRTDIHFICMGDGTELGNIKNMVKNKELLEYFTFPGRVSDDFLLEALNTADICVNPDEYNEMNDKSTMNKIMEYMALGKPIVQFNLTEGRYSAQDASLYAIPNNSKDLADKICLLLDDPVKRKKMGAFGYDRIRNELSWAHEKENLIKAYQKLFSKK